MYIGKIPATGAFQKCDNLSASGTADYTLQVGSVNVVPESVNHMIVSLNGVIQSPTTAFTVSGSTLSFASSLTSSDTIDFVMLLGNVLDIGVCSDSTVTSAKLSGALVTPSTLKVTNSSDVATNGSNAMLQAHSTAGETGISSVRYSNNAYGTQLHLGHSRNGTPGSNTIVADNDILGYINFVADDGTDLRSTAAQIRGAVNGTPGANDMPGMLQFLTTADGSQDPTERVRIHSGGVMSAANGIALGVGTANTASNVLDDYEEGTWTPVVDTANGFSTGATNYTGTTGPVYTKIGNRVFLHCQVQMGNSSGNIAAGDDITITGIPFTSADTERNNVTEYRYNDNVGIMTSHFNTTTSIQCNVRVVVGTAARNGGAINVSLNYRV